MNPPQEIVVSASRRSDIPAFYMPWFMDRIKAGHFEVLNPYNRRVSIVPATPGRVHTIVFWSKNYGPFIDGGYGVQLLEQGYHLFFNFTINSENDLLEPNLPPLSERLEQLAYLSENFGNRIIYWRFDPICHYRFGRGALHDNLKDFARIGHSAAAAGIERCLTSFMDHYAKIDRRLRLHPGLAFVDPPLTDKIRMLQEMENRLSVLNIQLATCCEKDVNAALPPGSSIGAGSCVPNRMLMDLFGGKLSTRKDAGQRVKAGCGCMVSADIGSYRHHPCYHNCLFCYANPASGAGI